MIRMLGLSGVFMAMTGVVFAISGLIAGGLREKVISRPCAMTRMRRVFAGTFVVLGLRLATVST